MTTSAAPTRIALYGGSFNPPHVGHVMVASWVLWTGRADQVWWTPCFAHPFGKELAPFSERVRWLEMLLDEHRGMQVCRVESELSGTTYTVDVLDCLAARHPNASFRLLLGSDNLASLHRWKESQRLVDSYAPIIVGRVGYPCEQDTVEFPGVSSTEVRDRLATGRSVDHLVPARIRAEVRGFYSSGNNGGPKPSQP